MCLQNRGEIKHIDDADEEKTEALLLINPNLLLLHAPQVVHRTTQQVYLNITPLQLAYGEGNSKMCTMMKKYFLIALGSIEAAQTEMRQQIDEKHSASLVAGSSNDTTILNDVESQVTHMKSILAPLLLAIERVDLRVEVEWLPPGLDGNFQMPEDIQEIDSALGTFRAAFKKSQPKTIQHGKRFHLEVLQTAYKILGHTAKKYDAAEYSYIEAAIQSILPYMPINDWNLFRYELGLKIQELKGKYDVLGASVGFRQLISNEANCLAKVIADKSAEFDELHLDDKSASSLCCVIS